MFVCDVTNRSRIVKNTTALPQTGFVRLKQILAPQGPIPVSKSTWWAGVKDGRFPQPLKLGERVTVWRAEDIHSNLLDNRRRLDHGQRQVALGS